MSQYNDQMNKKAVALSYDEESNAAPVIVASGTGFMAEKIIETARKNGIPVYEDNSLATMLTQLELGSEIPEQLYQAIVEIYVYFLNFATKKAKLTSAAAAGSVVGAGGDNSSAASSAKDGAGRRPSAGKRAANASQLGSGAAAGDDMTDGNGAAAGGGPIDGSGAAAGGGMADGGILAEGEGANGMIPTSAAEGGRLDGAAANAANGAIGIRGAAANAAAGNEKTAAVGMTGGSVDDMIHDMLNDMAAIDIGWAKDAVNAAPSAGGPGGNPAGSTGNMGISGNAQAAENMGIPGNVGAAGNMESSGNVGAAGNFENSDQASAGIPGKPEMTVQEALETGAEMVSNLLRK